MCSKSAAKILLIVINSVFLVLGGVALGVGLFVLLDKSEINGILSRVPSSYSARVDDVIEQTSMLEDSAIALICAGGVIFIIAALGFFGAFKGNKIMLYVYCIIVMLIFCCEVAAGVLGYIYKERVDTYLRDFLNDTIVEKYDSGTFSSDTTSGTFVENIEPVSAAWDFTMVYFQCCGNNNHTDFLMYGEQWNNTITYNNSMGEVVSIEALVPITCCKTSSDSQFPSNLQFEDMESCITTASEDSTNHENCYDKLYDLFITYAYVILGIGIGIACVELIGIIAACCLIRALNKDE